MSDRRYSNYPKIIVALGTTVGLSLCYLYNSSKNNKQRKSKTVNKTVNKTVDKTVDKTVNENENETTKQKLIDVLNSQGKINKELFDEKEKQNALLSKFDSVIKDIHEKNKKLEVEVKNRDDNIRRLEKSIANNRNTIMSNSLRLQKLEMNNPECSFFDNQETVLPHLTSLSTIHEDNSDSPGAPSAPDAPDAPDDLNSPPYFAPRHDVTGENNIDSFTSVPDEHNTLIE